MKLSQSLSDQENADLKIKKILLDQQDDKDLWEDLETAGIKGAKAIFASQLPDDETP